VLVAAGCIGTPEGTTQVPVLDYELFVSDVQVIFVERCGNPACHGRPERPFSVFGPEWYRADPSRTFLDEPLTDAEVLANYERACAFSLGISDPTDCLLLRKPLALAAGGVGHLGGEVWSDRDDTEARVVEAWLATAGQEQP
jgi:hypothetical protein